MVSKPQLSLFSFFQVLMLTACFTCSLPALAEDSKDSQANAADLTTSFDDRQSKAFVLVMNGKTEDGKKIVEAALKEEKDPSKRMSLIYMLAAVESMGEEHSAAINHLEQVLKSQKPPQNSDEHLQKALLLKRIGDCYWAQRSAKPALNNYLSALAECMFLPKDNPLISGLLESIVGTYVYDKDYDNGETYVKRLLEETNQRAVSGRLEDVAALFWARVQALNIYRHLGKETERQQIWQSSTALLDSLLALRAKWEAANQLPELETIKKDFEERSIAQFRPQTPAEYLWLANEFKFRSLPLIQWPATGPKARASILCIHGLGLENRSFTSFGKEMASRGYSVYALDVRGFGSWQTAQGQEDVQFSESIKDIGAMLNLIKQRENGVPVFLLGESMGGAIALRAAAEYGDALSGVISSVPSAERFQQRRMTMTVAFHLLQGGKNKPFKVGDIVTDQATKNVDLAERWKADYKAKMDMSPKELIKFAVFMRTTKKECEKIKSPVFVVQGLKDRLVKPHGTFELFDAIEAEDKNLLILGTSEHLIFETFTPSKLLLDALTTWMDEHNVVNKTNAAKN